MKKITLILVLSVSIASCSHPGPKVSDKLGRVVAQENDLGAEASPKSYTATAGKTISGIVDCDGRYAPYEEAREDAMDKCHQDRNKFCSLQAQGLIENSGQGLDTYCKVYATVVGTNSTGLSNYELPFGSRGVDYISSLTSDEVMVYLREAKVYSEDGDSGHDKRIIGFKMKDHSKNSLEIGRACVYSKDLCLSLLSGYKIGNEYFSLIPRCEKARKDEHCPGKIYSPAYVLTGTLHISN